MSKVGLMCYDDIVDIGLMRILRVCPVSSHFKFCRSYGIHTRMTICPLFGWPIILTFAVYAFRISCLTHAYMVVTYGVRFITGFYFMLL